MLNRRRTDLLEYFQQIEFIPLAFGEARLTDRRRPVMLVLPGGVQAA